LKSISAYLIILYLIFFSFDNGFAQSPIPSDAKLEMLATGFLQPEGPVWVDSLGILFSDIKANKIYRWSPIDSALTTYLNPSDSSNGLTLDLQGRLVLTQMTKRRRVVRQELNGTLTPLATTYNGKKFNSPNDLVVKSDGSIFFTDPDYNTPSDQTKEMGFKGVFRISPSGIVYVLDSTSFDKPNGICFSPDELKLYINDVRMVNFSPQGKIYVWDVDNDSTITNKTLFYTIPVSGYADGMKVDPVGNLYCSGPKGIWVISPLGVCLDTILMPNNAGASNCNWGDTDRKTLYITSGSSLYRIRIASTTGMKDQGFLPSKTFELYNNYPNPFNPSTIIQYQVKKKEFITIRVFDLLGCEVAALVNEFKNSGTHSIEWNASDLPSGIYLCQMKAGKFAQTKKLVLIK
jgi:gluconolactonase